MIFGTNSSKSKKFRWKVTLKGVRISRHYTKKAAITKAKSIRGARVTPFSQSSKRATKRRTTRRKRRY